jgi:L-lysine 6-transaminase
MASNKPLTKKDVERIAAKDVHSVLGRVLLVDGFDFVYDLEKSSGKYLYDAKTGRQFLDFFSMFASWPISHNHPLLKDFESTLAKVAAHNPANSDIYTVEMAKFVATFERVAMPPEFKHLFFVQGGSNAVENALKTAFDWKVRKNIAKGNGERGSKIIHFVEAFHGRGGYTMSLTNTQDPNKYLYFPRFTNWPRIQNPKARFPLVGKNLQDTVEAEQASLAQLKQVLDKDADDIAAIILEPIQGEGGDNHFRPEFWKDLRALADKYDVLLIADEVQSGMGLTGKFWAYQHYGIVPDIICFGKKAQVCGIMTTKRIDEVPDNVFKVSSRINSTWGGNLVDMARSRKFLEIIEQEKLVENSAKVGGYLLSKLEDLQKKYPQHISSARGKGLMCAFDTSSPEACSKVKRLAYDKNILLISCGTQTIRFRPLLDTSTKEIDIVVTALDDIFRSFSKSSL